MLLWNLRSYYIHISKGGGDVGAVKDREKWEIRWCGMGMELTRIVPCLILSLVDC